MTREKTKMKEKRGTRKKRQEMRNKRKQKKYYKIEDTKNEKK